MAYGRDDFDPSDREPRTPRTPQTPAGGGLSYEMLGFDADNKQVYRGSDGNLYTDGPGPNGFVPYTGSGVVPGGGPNVGPSGPKPPPPTGGGGGAGASTTPTPFAWPQFTPPSFTPAGPFQGPSTPYTFTPFSYGAFKAPTLEEARNAPGYQFGLQQGQDALLNAAARMGVARGGGTLKDLFNYTNAAAEQNYGNVFNQDLTGYTTNRDTAFNQWAANQGAAQQAYGLNYGVSKDIYNLSNQAAQQNYLNAFQNATAAFNPQFQASQLTFSDMYNRWKAKLDSLTNIATSGAR